MLNFILCVSIFLCTFLVKVSLAEDLDGYFRCKVVSVELIKMEDGRAEKYSGYRDGMKVGHDLFFRYKYSPTIRHVRIDQGSNDFSGFNSFSSGDFERKSITDSNRSFATDNLKIFVGDDFFSVTFLGDEKIYLTRYYKNDWHGLYYDHNYENELIISGLDCRHPKDSLDDIINRLQ